jgi:Capsule assembly protein Wzi
MHTWLVLSGNAQMAFFLTLVFSSLVRAQPDVFATLPWMPSMQSRSALHFLVDEGQLALPLGQWPLPASAVREALAALPSTAPDAVLAARKRVEMELDQAASAQLSLVLRNRTASLNGFGEEGSPGSHMDVRSPAYQTNLFAAQMGLRVDQIPSQALPTFQNDNAWRLHNAGIATRLDDWNVQAVANQRWWGVGWQSSLVLSGNAPSMNALSLQRASARAPQSPWLAWVGPWSFEAFLGRMENHASPVDPLLLGTRLSFRPLPTLELGFTKVTQTGGQGRPGGVKNLTRAFWGLGSNADTPAQKATDPGNSLGGFDLRLRCPSHWRCALYSQLMGEDQAGILPSKYLGLWGAEWWTANGSQRYFAEYSDTHCFGVPGKNSLNGCAYANGSYAQGYTHYNRWLGASQGADARLLSLGWLNADSMQTVKLATGSIGSQLGNRVPGNGYTGNGSLRSITWQKQWQTGRVQWVPELGYTRIQEVGAAFKNWRAGVTLNWPAP